VAERKEEELLGVDKIATEFFKLRLPVSTEVRF
jgi:hypothetical protein